MADVVTVVEGFVDTLRKFGLHKMLLVLFSFELASILLPRLTMVGSEGSGPQQVRSCRHGHLWESGPVR